MLMYRRVDSKENTGFYRQSEWSKSIQDLCKDMLNDEDREKSRKEWEKNVCKVKANMVLLLSYYCISLIYLSSLNAT